MDTIWRWLGYSKKDSSSSTTAPSGSPTTAANSLPTTAATSAGKTPVSNVTAEAVNNAISESENVIENKMKPVLGELNRPSYSEKFDTWAREKLPLEPEDNLTEKLSRTALFSGYFFFLYMVLTHPHITSSLKNKKLYKNTLKLFITVGFCSFMHSEWYVPLYVKTDKHGNRLPRTYPDKLKADWKDITGFFKKD